MLISLIVNLIYYILIIILMLFLFFKSIIFYNKNDKYNFHETIRNSIGGDYGECIRGYAEYELYEKRTYKKNHYAYWYRVLSLILPFFAWLIPLINLILLQNNFIYLTMIFHFGLFIFIEFFSIFMPCPFDILTYEE